MECEPHEDTTPDGPGWAGGAGAGIDSVGRYPLGAGTVEDFDGSPVEYRCFHDLLTNRVYLHLSDLATEGAVTLARSACTMPAVLALLRYGPTADGSFCYEWTPVRTR